MLKGILAGALVGALLAAGAYRAFAWHGASESQASPAPAASPSKQETAADPELLALRTENERLLGELASLEKAAADTAVKPAPKKGLTWKDLGAKVYRMRDKLADKSDHDPEETELMADFLALLSEAAKKDGVSIEEAVMGPEGMLGLLMGILEGSDLPPDAAQMAKLEATMAAAEKSWKDYLAGRGELSGMEKTRDLLVMTNGGLLGIRGTLRADQLEMLDKLNMFAGTPSMGQNHRISGDRAIVTEQLGNQWKSSLKLDDTQAASIVPIVGEYMRAYDEIHAEAERRKAAGEKEDAWKTAVQEAELMVSVQKRMKETLRLTEAQEKAMKEWSGGYGYEVTPK